MKFPFHAEPGHFQWALTSLPAALGSSVPTSPRRSSRTATSFASSTIFARAHVRISTLLGDRVEFVEGDLVNPRDVERALEGVEVIFHEAALASVPRSVETPLDTNAACVTGTVTLLDGARRSGVRRVVYAGSSSAYGDQPIPAKHEKLLAAPLSPYAAAKLAGELYCQAFTNTYGLETVTLRYFNVFGPRQDPNSQYAAVIPKFITQMLAGRRPTIFGDGTAVARFYVRRQRGSGKPVGSGFGSGRRPNDQRRLWRVV